jgi:hypothetical protein
MTLPPDFAAGTEGGVSSSSPLILICGVKFRSSGGATDGKELLVIIVALELRVPKISARPT